MKFEELCQQCWNHDPGSRPQMKDVASFDIFVPHPASGTRDSNFPNASSMCFQGENGGALKDNVPYCPPACPVSFDDEDSSSSDESESDDMHEDHETGEIDDQVDGEDKRDDQSSHSLSYRSSPDTQSPFFDEEQLDYVEQFDDEDEYDYNDVDNDGDDGDDD